MTGLLQAGDPAPVELVRPDGAAAILLVCDHAGQAVPGRLAGAPPGPGTPLGIARQDLDRHIGWDIGAGAVTRTLAAGLDAPAILQRYSRLVIDCNRRPGHPTSIAPVSDGTVVPANQGSPPAWAAAREAEIFTPYHAAIADFLDREAAAGRRPAVVAVHSFTPVMAGVARQWHAGVLFNRDPRLALAVAALLRRDGMPVGENEPYALGDDSDYTIPVHAEARGLPYLELEIRQDLIGSEAGQAAWAALLAHILPEAMRSLA